MSKSSRQSGQLRGFRVELAQLSMSHPFTVRRLERLFGLGLFHAQVRNAESETPA